MTRGTEKQVIEWLKTQKNKIVLPHIGVLREVQEIGKINDNRKKGDVYLNGYSVSFKDVESSFLYNRLSRKDLLRFLDERTVLWFDQKVKQVHQDKVPRNFDWHESMDKNKFKALLRALMMQMNPISGISSHPADYILTHPRIAEHPIDISIFTFEEFFDLFADRWITYAFLRCWYGQGKDKGDTSEHNRAKRLLSDPENAQWVFDDIAGNPKDWRSDIPVKERKTCYTCSIEIKSPTKWSKLRRFRLSLLESGFFGIDSAGLEKATGAVKQHFGDLIAERENPKWGEVLEIANQARQGN